jgi:hypothetical protein
MLNMVFLETQWIKFFKREIYKLPLNVVMKRYNEMALLLVYFRYCNAGMLMLLIRGWGPGYFILLASFTSLRLKTASILEFLTFPMSVLNNLIVIVVFN